MGSDDSVAQQSNYVLPGPSIGDEQAEKFTVAIGDLGLVSLREIHTALSTRWQCICRQDHYDLKAEPSADILGFPSLPPFCPDYLESYDQSESGNYSLSTDQPWFDSECSTVPPWPEAYNPQFLEPTNMLSETFDTPVTAYGDMCYEVAAQAPSIDSAYSTSGGSADLSSAALNDSTYASSSGGHSVSGDEEEPRFACSECRTSFPTYYTLESHARTTGHRAYVCPEPGCDSKYYRRDVFVRHVKAHRESGLHICKICERTHHRKAFKRKDHLRAHILQLHPGESVKDASGKTPPSRSSPTDSHAVPVAPICRGDSATLIGDRLKTALAKDRGQCREKV